MSALRCGFYAALAWIVPNRSSDASAEDMLEER